MSGARRNHGRGRPVVGQGSGLAFGRREFLKFGAAMAAASNLFGRPGFTAETTGSAPRELPPLEVIALNRIAFGARSGDFESFRSLGKTPGERLVAYVEEQLWPDGITDSLCERRLVGARLSTLGKSLKQLWADHVVAANALKKAATEPQPSGAAPPGQSAERFPFLSGLFGRAPHTEPTPAPKMMDDAALRLQPIREVEIATWLRAVYSRRQLYEVLVDFWHNHFSVFGWDQQIAPVFAHYDRDVIRSHALGNFREMLEAVAKSPAMLFYLDNFVNQSGNPNENFARELFELHTLGAENYLGTRDRNTVPGYAGGEPIGYVDGDVYEASRCFTGWRVDGGNNTGDTGEFLYFEPWHDRFQKIVLGHPLKEYQPPLKDGHDVLDLVASHPGTSRHIALKLCRRLISDDPPQAVVEAAAKVFREKQAAGDQLRQVVRVIVLSEEFRTIWGQKLKRPFEVVANMLRATEADFFPSDPFLNNFQFAGERLFQWRTPDGYPDARDRWGGTSSMLGRWRFANQLAAGSLPGVKFEATGVAPSWVHTPLETAEFWSRRILGRPIARRDLDEVAQFLSRTASPSGARDRLAATVALILMSPDFQVC